MYFLLFNLIFLLLETLRKYPPATNLSRKTQNNYNVPGTDLVIEKGISVLIPIYSIHHDPAYYPNPEIFDPDRFDNSEGSKKRDSMTWLPFGEGNFLLKKSMLMNEIEIILLFCFCRSTKLYWNSLWYDANKNWSSHTVKKF